MFPTVIVIIALSVYFECVSSSHSQKKMGCFKVNNCKCILKDGSGVINLKAMGDPEGFLGRWKPVTTDFTRPNEEILLSFSPCLAFSESDDLVEPDCSDVAACLIFRYRVKVNRYISRYKNYGSHEGNEFHYNDSTMTLSVSYFALAHTHGDRPRTVVHYHCSPNTSVSFIQALSLKTDEPLEVWVESPCACANACAMGDLGPGTIFLILLSLSAAAYFILGTCALRPFRTSSGVQIAPEESVWCMLCYLFTERKAGRRRKRHCSRDDTL